jgi:hypothetical protein
MRSRSRTLLAYSALTWVAGVVLWHIWLGLPRLVRADRVPEARWRQARETTARLPLSWQAGRGRPPLLPVSGDVLIGRRQVLLNGLALVPGTFQLRDVALTVEFRPEAFGSPGKLGRPLLPFVSSGRQRQAPPARGVELCCGIQDPAQAAAQGLHLRWDEALTMYGADNQTPLFPGRGLRLAPAKDGWCRLTLSVSGGHVVCEANDRRVFDFHLTEPPVGAVGVIAYEGCVALQRLEIAPPE